MNCNDKLKKDHIMKNTKLKNIIVFLVILFGIAIVPSNRTSALSASLTCSPKTANPNNEIMCIMSADSTGSTEVLNISSVHAEVAVSGNISLKNVGFYQGWGEAFSAGVPGKFIIAYVDGKTIHKEGSDIRLASFTVVAGPSVGKGTISVKNITFMSKEYTSNETPLTSNTETISVVAPVVIVEENKKTDTETKDTAAKDSETKNAGSTVAENKDTGATAVKPAAKTTPPIINDPKKSSNTYLSSLSFSDGVIAFDKETTEYSFSIPFNVTDIEVMTVVDDEKSTITVSGNTDLVVGENTITVIVTSENGATRTYTLTVTRAAEGEITKSTEGIVDKAEKSNLSTVFGAILLGLIGLGALIFFIFFLLKRKKDKKEEEPIVVSAPTVAVEDEIIEAKTDDTIALNQESLYVEPKASTEEEFSPTPDYNNSTTNVDTSASETSEDPIEETEDDTPTQDNYYQ